MHTYVDKIKAFQLLLQLKMLQQLPVLIVYCFWLDGAATLSKELTYYCYLHCQGTFLKLKLVVIVSEKLEITTNNFNNEFMNSWCSSNSAIYLHVQRLWSAVW